MRHDHSTSTIQRKPRMSQAMSVLTSHETCEWYTPSEYIEMARRVLRWIDLDPASDAFGQTRVKARWYFTAEQDGLEQDWIGRVFLNPPYGKTNGKSNQSLWASKMIAEYEARHITSGVLLVNSTNGYRWWEELWLRYPVCLARERIRFIKPDGTQGGQAKRGQTFVYFGRNPARFAEVFSSIGRVIFP